MLMIECNEGGKKMPWCTKCKNEYETGTKVCADCGGTLTDSEMTQNNVTLIFGDEEQMHSLKKFLELHQISDMFIEYDEKDEVYELFVKKDDKEKASQITNIFLMQEERRKMEEEPPTEEEDSLKSAGKLYQNSADKAEENRSSAWTLLLVGGVGLIIMALGIMGVLPFHLTGINKYMVYGIMSALFILFVVMGIISMRNSLIFNKRAQSENSLRVTMLNWCKESMIPQTIDEKLHLGGEETDEVLYFRRCEKMKEELNHKFVNLDQEFLDYFIDEIYDTIFQKG